VSRLSYGLRQGVDAPCERPNSPQSWGNGGGGETPFPTAKAQSRCRNIAIQVPVLRLRAPLIAAVLLVSAGARPVATSPLAAAIPSREVGLHLGQALTVCGDVLAVRSPDAGQPGPLVFDLGDWRLVAAGQPADLSAAIQEGSRRFFSGAFDKYLFGRQVCVHGTPKANPNGLPTLDLTRVSDFRFFGSPPGAAPHFGDGAVDSRVDKSVALPVLLKRVDPHYTGAAMQAGVSGNVDLDAIVGPDGQVKHIAVTRSLDPFLGLDDEAIAAAFKWNFRPALDGGKPVEIRIGLELQFRLDNRNVPPSTQATQYPVPLQASESRMLREFLVQTTPDDFAPGVPRLGDHGLTAPTPLDLRAPRYPLDALQQGLRGQIVVDAIVDPDGVVRRARVARTFVGSVRSLDDEAVRSVRSWTFVSGKLGDTPTAEWVQALVDFNVCCGGGR
jgi:TonB family protein